MPQPTPPPGGFQEGAWYEGRRFLGGKFLAPGEHQPGQRVSEEVIGQTAPENVSFIQSQRIKANQIQAPTQISLPSSTAASEFVTGVTAEADQARKAQEDFIKQRKETADLKVA